ncbi:hypothetical protein, partial [Pseudomonas aeruginosa]|uniref:hypothetical protein n=3 Tax=Pseudomonas aeruginosa TaxID=287 RepID=UPI00195527A0
MVHKGKSLTRKGLPECRNGCVRAGEHEKATGEHPSAGAQWLSLAQFLPGRAQGRDGTLPTKYPSPLPLFYRCCQPLIWRKSPLHESS